MSPNPSIHILGTRLDLVNWQIIDEFCLDALQGKEPKQIVTLNGEFVLLSQKNPDFKEAINKSDLVICDSTNVFWAAGRQKAGDLQITPGSDLLIRLSKIAANTDKSVYLLGGQQGIAKKAAEELKKQIPNLKIAGFSAKNPDDETIIDDINKAKSDIVYVAYGAPKQELWITNNKTKLKTKILVGVGGTFDMLAGTTPRAPKFVRQIHMEWLWRLIIEPKRIRRIWNALIVFPVKVLFFK